MPSRLPLFPLSVALFPGAPLPLHIFEPRYRRMLADSLAGDRRFGITPVATEKEVPEPGAVGCVAEVRVNQELPDGRSNLVVVGGSRFTVSRLVDESLPYLVALVQPFEDAPDTLPLLDELSLLRTLFNRYSSGLSQLNDIEPSDDELPEDPVALTFAIAAAVECDLGIKQQLLAERSTHRRCQALTLLLPILTTTIEAGLQIHRLAHSNGKGGRMPKIVAGE
jgi:ATP-dependent Lon protease